MEKENLEIGEKVEKNDKKMSPVMSVLLGILFVIVGFFVGYAVSSYLTTDESVDEGNKTEENEDETSVEKLTVDSPIVKKLFEVFREDNDNFVKPDKGAYFDLNTSLTTKKYIAYKQLGASKFSEKNCSDFSSKYTKDGAECGIYSEMKDRAVVFNASALESKYRELFGKNVEYSNGEFSLAPISSAYYDEDKAVYAIFYHLDGDEVAPYSYKQTLESVNHVGNTLTLATKLSSTALEDSFENFDISITYTFEYEQETGNYILINRLAK